MTTTLVTTTTTFVPGWAVSIPLLLLVAILLWALLAGGEDTDE